MPQCVLGNFTGLYLPTSLLHNSAPHCIESMPTIAAPNRRIRRFARPLTMNTTVERIVERFHLDPHPEGGYFREVYRSDVILTHPAIFDATGNTRCGSSLIYFLLGAEDFSAFHRVRWTDEIWHLYTGGPIELHLLNEASGHSKRVLSSNLETGEPTTVVPAGCWQAARLAPNCEWAFGGCTVAPGFEFADFEMPPRQELIERYPAHADIVTALTRS